MLRAAQSTPLDAALDKYFLSCTGAGGLRGGSCRKTSSGESRPDNANGTLNGWGGVGAERIMVIN